MPRPSKTKVWAGIFRITPEIAAEWLEYNAKNRPINLRVVDQYRRDMAHVPSNWMITTEGIGFDWDWHLVNGQHRLKAIVASQTAQDCLVVFNLDPRCFMAMDTGFKRPPSQVLDLMGVTRYTTHIAAAVALQWRLEAGALNRTDYSPSIHDRIEVWERFPDIEQSAEFVIGSCGKLNKFAGSSAVAVLIHCRGSRTLGNEQADSFFMSVAKGTKLNEDDPAYQLREDLIQAKELEKRLRQREIMELWVPAWNAHVRGDRIRPGSRWKADYSKVETVEIL